MIPIKLSMGDFLSYGDPDPIDFSGFDVACLSGPNGSGKSSILDAITWSLFGCARGCEGGQNQDRLIRDGADEASVDFEFGLGGSCYRVERRRNRNGRSELRFLVADGDDWTNIAGETLRETESRIGSTLRMDYKTFTASALFVQGRAEDFLARMKPEERKEVFARLLDLGAYEKLEAAARTKARDAEQQRAACSRRLEEAAGVPDELSKAEAEATEIGDRLKRARCAQEHTSEELDAHRSVVAELSKDEVRLDAERRALAEAEKASNQIVEAIADKERDLSEEDGLVARSEEVRSALAEADRLKELDAEAQKSQRLSLELEGKRAAALERVEGERKALESRLAEQRKRIAAIKAELRDLSNNEKALQRVESTLEGSDDPQATIDETRRAAAELAALQARLEEQLLTIESTSTEIGERVALLHRGEGECPVCGGTLDGEHRRRVERSLREQSGELSKRRSVLRADLETARKEAARCAEELRRLMSVAKEREELIGSRDGLRARLERLPAVAAELDELTERADADAAALQSGGFAADARIEAERLQVQIAKTYDAVAHEATLRRIAELEPYAALGVRIEEAGARRAALQDEIGTFRKRGVAGDAAVVQRSKAVTALETRVRKLPAATDTLAALEAKLECHRLEASKAAADEARISERLDVLRRAAADRLAAVAAEQAAATEHRRYHRLVQAFGRGGIPDLIIDNARPDLEGDANAILGRLTDYEMSIQFEMQRGTKSGKAVQTFDVLVTHDGGVRDFAMFSGGEAFRIAFAVRLALSKLLVRRAGARLETLVIDEGFGTQDPAGRERLVEAIGLARQEFAKVLVISHLDDLKDLFDAQLEVTKDPMKGSSVRLLGV